MKLSAAEVRRYITDFLDGRGGPWDWDDFTSIPIDDPQLDSIRGLCGDIRDRFPPKEQGHYCSAAGFDELRRLVKLLDERTGPT